MPRLAAPLAAISASVVGVIGALGLVFGRHVFWPQGLAKALDAVALVIAADAIVALFRFGKSVVPVIAASAPCGLAAGFIRS